MQRVAYTGVPRLVSVTSQRCVRPSLRQRRKGRGAWHVEVGGLTSRERGYPD
jgi:hypothetical protein